MTSPEAGLVAPERGRDESSYREGGREGRTQATQAGWNENGNGLGSLAQTPELNMLNEQRKTMSVRQCLIT